MQPLRHSEQPRAVRPLMMWPLPHRGQGSPSFTVGREVEVGVDVLAVGALLGCVVVSVFFLREPLGFAVSLFVVDLDDDLPFGAGSCTAATRRLLLSAFTSWTICHTMFFSSLTKVAAS